MLDKRKNGMSTDYERGYKQFAEMVGEENIELHEIFEAIFQVAAYAGFAAAWDALEKLAEVVNKDSDISK
jgi:alkylhydroperoxidase/carboxymuconolactone decarboxylase family protein YurZ